MWWKKSIKQEWSRDLLELFYHYKTVKDKENTREERHAECLKRLKTS